MKISNVDTDEGAVRRFEARMSEVPELCDEYYAQKHIYCCYEQWLEDELLALRSSNEALREALDKARIELEGIGPNCSLGFHIIGVRSTLDIVRTALHDGTKGEGK